MGCPDTSAHLPVQAGVKALPPSGYATSLSTKSWLASGNASSVRVKLADVDIYATHEGLTTRLRSRRDLGRLAGSTPAFVQVVPRGATPPPAPVLVPFGESVVLPSDLVAATGVEAIEYFDTGTGLVPYLRLARSNDVRPVPVCLVSDTSSARRGVGHHQPRPVIARAASREVAASVWNDVARRLDEKQRTADVKRRFNRLQHTLDVIRHSKDAGLYTASALLTGGLANVAVKGVEYIGTATEVSYGVEDVAVGEPLDAFDNVQKLTLQTAINAAGPVGSGLGAVWSIVHAARGLKHALNWDPPAVTTGETLSPMLRRSLRRATLAAHTENSFAHAMAHTDGWAAVDTRGLAVTGETPSSLWLNPPLLDDGALAAEAEAVIHRHVDKSRGLSEHEAAVLRKRCFNEWNDGNASDRTALRAPGHVLNMVAQSRVSGLWDAEAFHNRKPRTGPPARRSRRGGRTYQAFGPS